MIFYIKIIKITNDKIFYTIYISYYKLFIILNVHNKNIKILNINNLTS
jgi:hypothetical protein